MRECDAVLVRCPGDLGLLGVLIARLVCSRRICKYAGNWQPLDGEPLFWRLQRAILRSGWWGAPVLTYDDWPGMPPHVVPWFSTAITDAQAAQARQAVAARDPEDRPKRVLFVGRLSASKRVDAVLRAVSAAIKRGIDLELTIVGDGPERESLAALAAKVLPSAHFVGARPHEEVLELYARSHVLVLVSRTEGWPKAITEAMAFGCVPIGSNSGAIPGILAGGRGVAVDPYDEAELADALCELVSSPVTWRAMSQAGAEWSQRFTLDAFVRGIAELVSSWWRSGNRPFPSRNVGREQLPLHPEPAPE